MDCDPFFSEVMFAHVNEGEVDDFLEFLQNFEGPNEVPSHVKILKDDSNFIFKKANV